MTPAYGSARARSSARISPTNAATLVATGILQEIWNNGYALGPAARGSPFDEAIERKWADVWLFYSNSIRFASATSFPPSASLPVAEASSAHRLSAHTNAPIAAMSL